MTINIENIEYELTQLLTDRYSNLLKSEDITFTIERNEEGGSSFSITPPTINQVKIVIFYENGSPIIYLTIGDNTVLEVPIDGERYTKNSGHIELLSLIDSVIFKGFEETVWRNDGRIIKSSAKLFVQGEEQPLTITNSSFHSPFMKKQIFVNKYLPYFEK